MDVILLVVHVLLALGIITLVLLQKGKGAAEGAAFGGGGAGSVFGASGSSNFLSKTTAIFATLFFANSIALAYMAANRDVPESVVETFTRQQQLDQTGEDAGLDALMPPVDDMIPAATDDIPPAAGDNPVSNTDTTLPPPADN